MGTVEVPHNQIDNRKSPIACERYGFKREAELWRRHALKGAVFLLKTFFKCSYKLFYRSYDHVQYISKVVQDHILTLDKTLDSFDT